MPIYTRTGDKGQTSLFGGTRVPKFHERVETYGTIDELNSAIGVTLSFLSAKHARIRTELEKIQHDLFGIGSALATPSALPVDSLTSRPQEFEQLIDDLTAKMPELRNFILPGGGQAGSFLHLCRTIARRAERRVASLASHEDIDLKIIIYLNRLSDLLFTLARYLNWADKEKEVVWRKK